MSSATEDTSSEAVDPALERGHAADEKRKAPALEETIAAEVRRLRYRKNLSLAELAIRAKLSKAMMSRIENAQTSCSLTTLARLAEALEVPVSALFRSATGPKDAIFTPAGEGSRVYGRDNKFSREYQILGSLVRPSQRLEPLLITLSSPEDTLFTVFQHHGIEFIHMMEGVMAYKHGEVTYTLRPGDSLLMDGEGWHGPAELVRAPVRYLAITTYADEAAVGAGSARVAESGPASSSMPRG